MGIYNKNKNHLCQELVSKLVIHVSGLLQALANQAAHIVANGNYCNWNPGMDSTYITAWTEGDVDSLPQVGGHG